MKSQVWLLYQMAQNQFFFKSANDQTTIVMSDNRRICQVNTVLTGQHVQQIQGFVQSITNSDRTVSIDWLSAISSPVKLTHPIPPSKGYWEVPLGSVVVLKHPYQSWWYVSYITHVWEWYRTISNSDYLCVTMFGNFGSKWVRGTLLSHFFTCIKLWFSDKMLQIQKMQQVT